MNHTTRIIIADDHASLRKALCRLFLTESRLRVVAEAENGSEALAQVEMHRPDVVLMDISMPVMNGFEATRTITTQFPGTKVIVLTAHTDECYLNSAYQAGASRCLTKSCGKQDLLDAILDCVFSR